MGSRSPLLRYRKQAIKHVSMMQSRRPSIVIVGGGLSAASLSMQLVRRTRIPIDIDIVEPREHLGRGLAYSATDPDHRLNAPLDVHWLDPLHPAELREWCEANRVFDQDPGCLTSNGQVFMRRSDYGKYVSAKLALQATSNCSGSIIRHIRDRATTADHENGFYRVRTEHHGELVGKMLVIATGNPVPSLRPPFHEGLHENPKIIANPLEPECLNRVPANARVLVVGSGLTALDIISTLVRRRDHSEILVVSRRGLRPCPQSPETLSLPPKIPMLATSIPDFLCGQPNTVRVWTKSLRHEIAKAMEEGRNWYAAFDSVRDVVWQLWPMLPGSEKQRFLRRLRVFYDVHRFRTPPMNEAMVADAERQGRVRYMRATLLNVAIGRGCASVNVEFRDPFSGLHKRKDFDAVVNCSGLDSGNAWRSNSFLRSLVEKGILRCHSTGIGFEVGVNCEAVNGAGISQPGLRIIGPPTAGVFGDPVAIPFIANQVRRILPDLLHALVSVEEIAPVPPETGIFDENISIN